MSAPGITIGIGTGRLAGASGRGVRIAVIDSGIAAGHPHVGAVGAGLALVGDDPADTADRLGHGTAVAAAIRDLAPDVELVPMRVLERDLATSARLLARAIEAAAELGVALVNLSFGTTNDAHRPLFEDALTVARAADMLVIAARGDGRIAWLPGSLDGALGVDADQTLAREQVTVNVTGMGASPYPRPIPGVPVTRNLAGVSFAVANCCGLLARAIELGAPRAPAAMQAWLRQP